MTGRRSPRDRQPQRASQTPFQRSGNVRGGSSDPNRGSWCTEKRIADAVGSFYVDPFSNARSHIVSDHRCMLEDGGDGFGDGKTPGRFRLGSRRGYGVLVDGIARAQHRVWLQPPYLKGFVRRAFGHYAHTRWTALLRFDPRTDWFKHVAMRAEFIGVLWSCNFEAPPGVSAPGSTFPHALFYRYADDVTDDVRRMTLCWRKKPTHG